MGKKKGDAKDLTPALLSVTQLCDYLCIGETKARELLHNPANGFTVHIGNRLYAHRASLDKWLMNQMVL